MIKFCADESVSAEQKFTNQFVFLYSEDNMTLENSQPEQLRQYGDEVNADEGLARLAQAQSNEEAMTIEASLVMETNFPVEETPENEPVS